MVNKVLNRKSAGRKSLFPSRHVRGAFDAARTHDLNKRHWAAAEGLSADSEASPDVRATLRNRARYEVANNSYAKGILLTLANDTIGTGPRLQMLTDNDDLNRWVEKEFMQWSAAVRLAEKLRTMRMARCQDGEAFAVLGYNPKIWHDVKMDLKLIEAEQVSSGLGLFLESNEVDGIVFDDFGNPESYRVMKHHPGGMHFSYSDDFIDVPAQMMLHIFRQDRPGLHRGVPELTAALPLFAQLRRYTQAGLSGAEAVANFSAVLYTDAPPDGESDEVKPMDSFELERNTLIAMPSGWKMGQIDPKQPVATYAEYVNKLIEEIIRCLLMPAIIAKGSSENSNFSSARLDSQVYLRMLRVEQSFIASIILDRILSEWFRELYLLYPMRGVSARYPLPQHFWFWDASHYNIDPVKEAKAQEIRLKNSTTNLATEFALAGKDWEAELRQRAREKKLMRELGLTDEEAKPSRNNNNNRKEEEDMPEEGE